METGSCPLWSEDSVEVTGLSNGQFLYFSGLSAFTPISDSEVLLLRPIRIHTTDEQMDAFISTFPLEPVTQQ